MNYTTFFVALTALGVIVFVGIFGAAWITAAERPDTNSTFPVNSQSPQPLPEVTGAPEATEKTSELSAAVPSTTFNAPEIQNDVSTLKPQETAFENPEIQEGPVRIAPEESSSEDPNEGSSTESSCPLEKLTDEKGRITVQIGEEGSCQRWLVEYEEGYSVDITVDQFLLDAAADDYVLISPDENTVDNEDNPVLSWKITTKKYRIPYKGTALIVLATHKSTLNNRSFRFAYARSGELTTTPAGTTAGPIPTPPPDNKESIFVSAIFKDSNDETFYDFRNAIASKAIRFCEDKNITRKTEITYENIYLSNQVNCISTWPDSDRCYTFIMAIPVDTKSSKKYELTKVHLQEMWDSWDGEELKTVGIEKTNGPNYKRHVLIWFLLSIVFIILFTFFLIFLWNWQIRYSQMPEENKPRESVPIEVPPLFDYYDTRLDDPEYLPYYDSMYDLGSETSTDDAKPSYGSLPPYTQRPSNFSSTFTYGRPSNAGIDNNAFFLEEDEDEEYEIMNRESLTKEIKNPGNEKADKTLQFRETNK